MLKKSAVSINKSVLLKSMLIWAMVGGILGAILGFRDVLPLSATAGIGLGIILGGSISALMQLSIDRETIPENHSESRNEKNSISRMQLREEQLDLTKKWRKTGDVAIHKELFTEEKTFTVPVTREELVIEKTTFDGKSPNGSDGQQETIRIPVCEERVEITKSPVMLEDVKINRHQFQENERVETTLKKEKINLATTGNAKVIEKEKQE